MALSSWGETAPAACSSSFPPWLLRPFASAPKSHHSLRPQADGEHTSVRVSTAEISLLLLDLNKEQSLEIGNMPLWSPLPASSLYLSAPHPRRAPHTPQVRPCTFRPLCSLWGKEADKPAPPCVVFSPEASMWNFLVKEERQN